MPYGFCFPKEGYNLNASVKDLAWRDDQQVFLARDRQTRTVTIPSGFNLDGQYYDLEVDLGVWDFYVYHAYIWASWGGNSRTYLADATQEIAFGGRSFIIQTQFTQLSDNKGNLRFWFRANGSGSLTTQTELTFSVYVCLQTIESNSVSGGVADSGVTGIKVSLPGYDVQTCTPKQCSLHSEYTALMARKIGTITLTPGTWNQVRHDFGYEPAYYGFFTGTAGGLSGLVPLGGGKSLRNNLQEDVRIESYVTTDSIYFYSTSAVTVYYYLFADLAGKALPLNQIPDDNFGHFGLVISQPGVDVRVAKPHQLRFCSHYPNFKVHSEQVHGGTSIPPLQQLADGVGQGDSTIRLSGANKYGQRGSFYICNWETIVTEEWHWSYAPDPRGNWDDDVFAMGINIKIMAEGAVFNGSWTSGGGFTGDARWTGDGGSRRFQFYKGGNWNTCDTGWTLDRCASWDNNYTWYRGNDEWVECSGEYVGYGYQVPMVYYKISQSTHTEYHQEKVDFVESNGSEFRNCSRGQGGTQARSWGSGAYIVPETMCFAIASNPFNYNPAFMGWTIGPFEADGARTLPTGNGMENLSVVLTGNTFYYTIRRGFAGENDEWFEQTLPHVYPGCYIKIMYDQIGT